MVSLIENNLPAIKDICRRYGVQKMFVFGSAARRGNFGKDSDIDLLYKLLPEIATHPIEQRPDFFEFLFTLHDLLGRNVNLIDLTRVHNPYFIQSVNQHKIKIYEA